jgi:hypothetical protein
MPSSTASSSGEVAQVGHLDLAVGVLVHRQRVDHANCRRQADALAATISPWKSGWGKPSTIN